MIDVKTPLRTAYYSLLNGALTSLGIGVPVSDTLTPISSNSQIYVLLASAGSRALNTQQSFMNDEQIKVKIVARGSRVSSATVDNIANQIYSLVLPSPSSNGLPVQPTVSIINCRVTDDNYLPFRTDGAVNIATRIITFTQTVTPGAIGTSAIPGVSGKMVYNEVPGGLINGSNTVFTTAFIFVAGSTEIYINGIRQTLNVHYTEGSGQITIVDPPQVGDTVQIDYFSMP